MDFERFNNRIRGTQDVSSDEVTSNAPYLAAEPTEGLPMRVMASEGDVHAVKRLRCSRLDRLHWMGRLDLTVSVGVNDPIAATIHYVFAHDCACCTRTYNLA